MFKNNLKVGKSYRLIEAKISSYLKVGDVFTVTCIENESKRFRYNDLNSGTFYLKNTKYKGMNGAFIKKSDIGYYKFEEVKGV